MKCCRKLFLGAVIGLALVMGILVMVLPQTQLEYLVLLSRFFEAMIPVLAIGALLKYLFSCTSCKCSATGCCGNNPSK